MIKDGLLVLVERSFVMQVVMVPQGGQNQHVRSILYVRLRRSAWPDSIVHVDQAFVCQEFVVSILWDVCDRYLYRTISVARNGCKGDILMKATRSSELVVDVKRSIATVFRFYDGLDWTIDCASNAVFDRNTGSLHWVYYASEGVCNIRS